MRGLADLAFGLLHAQQLAHRPVDPGPAVGGARPDALVEAGEHGHIRPHQPRLEKAKDGKRRRVAPPAADGNRVEPVTDDGGCTRQVTVAEQA